jgi:hypothetical protein
MPKSSPVAVFRAPLDGPPEKRAMPDGCTRLAEKPPVIMTEQEMEGQDDPYRVEIKEAVTARANVLLVLSKVIQPRRDFECPAASPITDCPPSTGSWRQVVFQSYSCTPEAVKALTPPPPAKHP